MSMLVLLAMPRGDPPDNAGPPVGAGPPVNAGPPGDAGDPPGNAGDSPGNTTTQQKEYSCHWCWLFIVFCQIIALFFCDSSVSSCTLLPDTNCH